MTKANLKVRLDENAKSLSKIDKENGILQQERAGLTLEKKRLETLLSINNDKVKALKRHSQLLSDENKAINKQLEPTQS